MPSAAKPTAEAVLESKFRSFLIIAVPLRYNNYSYVQCAANVLGNFGMVKWAVILTGSGWSLAKFPARYTITIQIMYPEWWQLRVDTSIISRHVLWVIHTNKRGSVQLLGQCIVPYQIYHLIKFDCIPTYCNFVWIHAYFVLKEGFSLFYVLP